MKLNKTRMNLISNLLKRDSDVYQHSWDKEDLTKGKFYLCIKNAKHGEQAHKLAMKYPEIFHANQSSWQLVELTLLNEDSAKELVKDDAK